MLNRSDVQSWSILSPIPQCCYHAPTRTHLVYWQGIAMIRVHAMILVQESWLQSWATPEMKVAAFNEFKRAYLLGGFGSVRWRMVDLTPDTYMMRLRKWILKNNSEFYADLIKNYSIKDAMTWFIENNEELITDDTL